MWDGPGQGPRGGPPFRGDHRGEMFAGRDGPMPDFRGRDGMNMGPRPLDLPPMDMRRGDGPPMRGRDMEQRDMRGIDQSRDFFGPDGERDRDFSLRRQYEMSIRDKLMTAPGFMGPGRNTDMEERGMPQRESMGRLMDMRDREMFRYDMPGGNNPNMDGRRGFPSEPMGRNDGFRDMRDRSPMGRDDIDGCDMDMPSRERGMMDFDRRGGPPFNARGGFDSDMDFRNRPGPEFRGRDRSPVRFGNDDRAPMERGRSGMPPDVGGPNRPDFRGGEGAHRDREFLHSTDSPPIDHYRSGEEMTLAEEWKSRRKEKPPITDLFKGMIEPSVPPGFGRESILGAPPPFSDRGRQPAELPGKDAGFPLEQFAARDLPPVGLKAPLDLPIPFPEMGHPGLLGRAPDSKLWLGEGEPKQIQNTANRDRRPSRFDNPDKNEKIQGPPSEGFKGLKAIVHDQRPDRAKMGAEPEFQSGSAAEGRDQDYRDIDYRTGSVRAFDYKHESFQPPEKVLKESKPFPPPKFSDSGSKDQDYRSASVEDQVSNTISIIGIPKTATMEQILGAFAVRDGVPMQGMKIKSVVPGYSYDTAYVEFLNLDDAVHFMESNKGSLKVGAKTASMKYVQPDKSERDLHASLPQVPEALLPGPGELLDSSQNNVNGSSQQAKDLLGEPLLDPLAQWQRNCDLTPEAWQQQVDQQLKQQEAELQAESWAGRANPPRHGPPPTHGDPIFKESKTMILKNVKPTTTVETILKALDPFAYLDERNVRLVKGKTPGAKCFCFVDMDSHEQVVRLVELLTKPRPLNVDGVRVYAEVAKPLKNQNIKRESDKPFTSLLGYPPDANMMEPPPIPDLSLQYSQHLQQQALHPPPGMQGDPMAGSMNAPLLPGPNYTQGVVYGESPAVEQSYHQPPPVEQSYHQAPPVEQSYHQAPPVEQSYHQAPTVDQSYHQPPPVDQSYHQAVAPTMSGEAAAAGMTSTGHGMDGYICGSETPDMSGYLYDGTSGFFYDPQTTLYYDPNSRYFYNSQTQEYLYWDGMTKTYIPVPSGGSTAETAATQQPLALSAEVQAILANPAADAPLEMKKPAEPTPVLPAPTALPIALPPLIVPAVVAPEVQPPAPEVAAAAAASAAPAAASTAAPPPAAAASTAAAAVPVPITPTPTPPEPAPASALTPERREDDDSKKDNKEEKPRSLAAVKIMKDMERWAKIQNRQKDAVRSPSPVVLKPGQDDKRTPSKAADAGFAIFAKAGAGDDLFKKPLAPPSSKKDEKGKRHMGSLGLLASDYGAGSDEEVEEEKHDAPKPSKSNKKSDDKDDKLTDWKKMACLLCRRQFPNKDALIRHQQLSDLHKQNMEIHLKIKRSKKELEALENQEKELIAKDAIKSPPETKKRKHHHQQHQHNTWAGSSKDSFKGSERPGLGAEPVERKKKEPVVWDHATYKQAVRKAMFARFKELE